MTEDNANEWLWGPTTELAIENFPISGQRVPAAILAALAAIKAEAARVNVDHGVVPAGVGDAIAQAAELIAADVPAEQFPVDVYQTGSGTSTNMNMNEVIATLATRASGTPVHPNDAVNASQSSNDAFPGAIRIALVQSIVVDVAPSLAALHAALTAVAGEHARTVKLGRTHLMDAVPMAFGDEVGAWAAALERARGGLLSSVAALSQLPLGGTAVGTGLNAPAGFGAEVAQRLARRFNHPYKETDDHFASQATIDDFVAASAALRSVALCLHKIAGDLRLLSSGPFGGLGEVGLPALQPGSSIMPGKVNPVIPEAVQQVVARVVGNDATVCFAATLSTLQLNTALPVVGMVLLESADLLGAAAAVFATRCIEGMRADAGRMRELAARSPAVVTALAGELGYDRAAQLAKMMVEEGRTLAEVIAREEPALAARTHQLDIDALARGAHLPDS